MSKGCIGVGLAGDQALWLVGPLGRGGEWVLSRLPSALSVQVGPLRGPVADRRLQEGFWGWGQWFGDGIIFLKGRTVIASHDEVLANSDQCDTVPSDPRNCAVLCEEN